MSTRGQTLKTIGATSMAAALVQKDMIDFGAPLGMDVIGSPSLEDFARTLKADAELWGPYVRRIGFTAES